MQLVIGPACLQLLHSLGGVVLSSDVMVSPTSLTISWTLVGGVTATGDYNISYFNTNTQCFNDSKDITGITATETILTGLQNGTQYSITVTVLLSGGMTGADSTTATTIATGKYSS